MVTTRQHWSLLGPTAGLFTVGKHWIDHWLLLELHWLPLGPTPSILTSDSLVTSGITSSGQWSSNSELFKLVLDTTGFPLNYQWLPLGFHWRAQLELHWNTLGNTTGLG
jgi:hypothetical protein